MESSVVIKVKYGDTLRRFNARIVDEKLDLNVYRLREKILCLFSFSPETDLTLTYLDEDRDVVTLVDDEDLQDVARQALNPLRITVKIKSEKSGKPSASSSGNSTPLRSPRVHSTLPNLSSNVSEILKSVPDPFRDMLSKLSGELASKATSSAPGLAELVDSLSNLLQSPETQVQNSSSERTMNETASKNTGSSKVDGTESVVLPSANTEELSLRSNEVPAKSKSDKSSSKNDKVKLGNATDGANSKSDKSSSKKEKVKVGNTTDGPKPSEAEISEEVKSLMSSSRNSAAADSLNRSNPTYESATSVCKPRKSDVAVGKEKVKKLGEFHALIKNADKWGRGRKPINTGGWGSSCYMKGSAICSETQDLIGWPSSAYTGIGKSSDSYVPSLSSECPFTGMPLVNDLLVPPIPPQYTLPEMPLKRSYPRYDVARNVFHRGVRCDGCGVHPITGPRFKSKVKEDYDLCGICFEEMGNDSDYIRMDRPAFYRGPLFSKGLEDHYSGVNPLGLPQVFRGCAKPGRPKLDSRFIQDVNVMDGTIMAPSTPFTKIWRMRNNGNTLWSPGTQLVWIGGDRLSDMLSVELAIAASGVPVDHELNVAVDFVAPELPGRYVSYWRMASPSGQKFGQRVWALIQVSAHTMEQMHESFRGINLNLPPAGDGMAIPEIINVDPEPRMEETVPEPDNSNKTIELVEPVKDDANVKEQQETIFPINDSLLIGTDASKSSLPVPPHFSYSMTDLVVEPSAPLPAPSPASRTELVGVDIHVEANLLRELEEMGFKQVDLNKEILRLNQYDLEKSVDDLCGVSGWDPMLEELQEMGFNDTEKNKKLLIENNGSIKRVVMDLIAGEK